jgi:prepilin-type N-terminal cleavage/methylation domain-containing protein
MLKSEKGMTLIEILASVTIITVVLTTFFSFFIQNRFHTGLNGQKFAAEQLAQQKLSNVLQLPEENVLSHHCSAPPEISRLPLACFDFKDKIGGHTYRTYVFVEKKDTTGLHLVISRAYYKKDNYTELYNYYTPENNGELSQ